MRLSVCSTPGCPELTSTGQCDVHRRSGMRRRQQRRTRARGNTPTVIRTVRLRDGDRCTACGATTADIDRDGQPVRLEVAHIVADADGGSSHPDNLRLLCRACHLSEHHG